MKIEKRSFGKLSDGREAFLYIIDNGTIYASVTDFGAALVSVLAPDKNGVREDVVLGYDSVEGYESPRNRFFGASVAPVANRTDGAIVVINGTQYQMPVNENGNNLHSDYELGGHHRLWKTVTGDSSVTFTTEFPDGQIGLPGNRKMSITYTVTDLNEIMIHYHAVSDRETIFSPTNHSYFNIAGHKSGTVLNQMLTLNCSAFTPVRAGSIPTGEIRPVKGTAFDFTASREIGKDIDAQEEQLQLTGGYDHNFVIDGYRADGAVLQFARVEDPVSGRIMEGFTTLPGVQFYAGNFVNEPEGKDSTVYGKRSALCLETQFFPDSNHHPEFPDYTFGPDREYDSTTKYRFSVKA